MEYKVIIYHYSFMSPQIWSEELIVEKKVLPSLLPSHERDESIVLFRDVEKKSREEAEDRDFSLLYPRKVFQ